MTERLGDYELIRELGRGAMGQVWLARHVTLGREVALKLMQVAGERNLVRFATEAQAVARLQHPRIVKLHEAHLEGADPYLVMSYVEGESLDKRLEREGTLPLDAALALTIDLTEAVGHAHEQGVLHRDLKPANVLLDRDGQPFLTDFGLAKDLAASREALTRTGQIVGTPAFMAPEQARGEKDAIGPWTDVYGLGATLYAMLTGRAPHERTNMMALVAAVAKEPPTPLRELRPEVPTNVANVVQRCLEKSPSRRYASASDLTTDLARARAGERISAPTSWRGIAAAAAIAAVLAIGAALIAVRPEPAPAPPSSPSPIVPPIKKTPRSTPAAEPETVEFQYRAWQRRPVGMVQLVVGSDGRLLAADELRVLLLSRKRRKPPQVLSVLPSRSTQLPIPSGFMAHVGTSLRVIGSEGQGPAIRLTAGWSNGTLLAATREVAVMIRANRLLVGRVREEPEEIEVGWSRWNRDPNKPLRAPRVWVSPSGRYLLCTDSDPRAPLGRPLICIDRRVGDRTEVLRAVTTVIFLPGERRAVLVGPGDVRLVSLPDCRGLKVPWSPPRTAGRSISQGVFALGVGGKILYVAIGNEIFGWTMDASDRFERIARHVEPILSLAVGERDLFFASRKFVGAIVLKPTPR